MKLGISYTPAHETPEEWAAALAALGCHAAVCPISAGASHDTIAAYREAAARHGVTIAEVGVWNSPIADDDAVREKSLAYCRGQLALADEIKQVKELDPEETESIDSEYEAIAETLALLEQEKLYTVAVYVKGKLEAFAIGERLSDNTAVEHFEKANDAYRGLYQLVLREFCERLPEEVLFVNREEDMGLLNLRQAKEALKPDHMMETCYVTFTA